MNPAFNLIDEPWIPLRYSDGRYQEAGIRETLENAHSILGIEDSSPLVTASLYRFLLALLYRALEGPTDITQACTLFTVGFPDKKIDEYLRQWKDRFWLFHDTYPFGQNHNTPEIRDSGKSTIATWAKLTAEYNPTVNKVLFDHTTLDNSGSRTAAECARWLLTTMNFSISAGKGYYPSPSANAVMCIPLGATLFHTLCYNLVPYKNKMIQKQDCAQWEREPDAIPPAKAKRVANGYADLYTWPSRMVLFVKNENTTVDNIRCIEGLGFENPQQSIDPMHAFRKDDKKGLLPLQFLEDRGIWRDFDSIFPADENHSPKVIDHATRLAQDNETLLPISIMTLGLRYKPPNANLDFWRMEQFVFSKKLSFYEDTVGTYSSEARASLHSMLKKAEEAQSALYSSCWFFAQHVIGRGKRSPENADIKKMVITMPCSSFYWSILEKEFHHMLESYRSGKDTFAIEYEWVYAVCTTMENAWNIFTESLPLNDANTLCALVKAQGSIQAQKIELEKNISEYKNHFAREVQ